MSDLSKYSVEELQGYYSDFYKDYYGHRPRFLLELDSWHNKEFLLGAINHIHDQIDRQKETFAGREELRQQGWVVEETDPELAKRAEWLRIERDREYDSWNRESDIYSGKEYA